MRYSSNEGKERGDTLIEVLLAIAILSVVIVAAVTMMNRGHAIALDSLERSQVTALMTEQAEILQYLRDSYDPGGPPPVADSPGDTWLEIVANRTSGIEPLGCSQNTEPFYLSKGSGAPNPIIVTQNDIIGPANARPRPGTGVWVEASNVTSSGSIEFIDFHVKGCWNAVGQGPQQEAKTIVRLYVP